MNLHVIGLGERQWKSGVYRGNVGAVKDMVAFSQQQAALTTVRLFVHMYTLKASLDIQDAAIHALI